MNAKRIALPLFTFLFAAVAALSLIATPQAAYAAETGSLTITNTSTEVARSYEVTLTYENGAQATYTVDAQPGETCAVIDPMFNTTAIQAGTAYSVTQLAYDNPSYAYIADGDPVTGVIGEMTYYYSDNGSSAVEITQSEYEAATGTTSGSYSYDGVVTSDNSFTTENTQITVSVTENKVWGVTYSYTATYSFNGKNYSATALRVFGRDAAIADAKTALESGLSNTNAVAWSGDNAIIYAAAGTVTTRTYYTSDPELDVALSFSTTLEDAPKATVSVNFAKLDTIPYADETATFEIYNADGSGTGYTAIVSTTSLASVGYTTYTFELPRGLASGTQYYLQQTKAPTGYDADDAQHWFTVNVDGSVTAATGTQMNGTTIYNNDYTVFFAHFYLFTNNPKVLQDGSVTLTQSEFTTTYNVDATYANETLLNAVTAAIDEENSDLPNNRTYTLQYYRTVEILGQEITGYWTDVPTDSALDADEYSMRLVVEDASENPDYNDVTSDEFTVTIERAPVEVTVNSQSITYGETPTDLVTTLPSDAEALKVYVGLGASDSALATGYVYLDIPSNSALDTSSSTGLALTALRELLNTTNVSLADLEEPLTTILGSDTVTQIFSYLPDSVKNITVSSGQPTEAGAYLVAGVSVDRNYVEGEYGLGYLTIAPDTTNTELQWNTDINTFITLDELAAGIDFDATLYKSGTAVEGANIQYRWLYVNEDGVSVEVDAPSADKPGMYSQIAYLYGSTQAAPIARSFAVYGEATVEVNSATIDVGEAIPSNLVTVTPEGIDTLTLYVGITGDGNGFIGVESSDPESTQAQTIVNALNGLNQVDLKQALLNLGINESTVEGLFYYLPEDTGTITVTDTTPVTAQSGTYAVAALVVETGYVPAADLGTLTVTKDEISAELQWNDDDASGIIPIYTYDAIDFTASVYVDNVEDENLQGNVKYLYTGTTESGSAYVSNQAPTEAGEYLQIAMLVDGTYAAESIQRTFTIINAYAVDVENGTAYNEDGDPITYAEVGDTVTIVADEPGTLQVFEGWTVTAGGATLTDSTATTTTFTMPEQNVAITAEFHTHVLEDHAQIDATCTENGTKAYYTCSGCNKTFLDADATEEVTNENELVIPALGHSMTKIEFQAATTTETSIYAHYICERCSLWFWDEAGTQEITNHDDVIIPMASSEVHVVGGSAYDAAGNEIAEATYGDTVTIKTEPTSLQVFEGWTVESGNVELADSTVEETTFTMGESTVQVTANYHTHTLVYYAQVAATCTEDGSKAYYQCSDEECSALFWDAEGTQPVADASELVIPATGHSLTLVEAKAPTATENGNKAYYVCENCGTWFWDVEAADIIENHSDVIIPATGQNGGNGNASGNDDNGSSGASSGSTTTSSTTTSTTSSAADAHALADTADSTSNLILAAGLAAAAAAVCATLAFILRRRAKR